MASSYQIRHSELSNFYRPIGQLSPVTFQLVFFLSNKMHLSELIFQKFPNLNHSHYYMTQPGLVVDFKFLLP